MVKLRHNPGLADTSRVIHFDPRFQQLDQDLQRVHNRLLQPFESLSASYEVVQDYVKSIQDIIQDSGRALVGVSGRNRCGKSATINSLLHANIARTGRAGQCTVVTTEYHGRRVDQVEPFLAEVVFYSPTTRREIITSLVHDYFGTTDATITQEYNATREDGDPYEQDSVIRYLMSLLKDEGHPDFESADRMHEFFADLKPCRNAYIVDLIMLRIEELLESHTGTNDTLIIESPTATHLLASLEGFDSDILQSDGAPAASMFRLVSKIRFHLSSPLTDIGVSFLDAPRLSNLPLRIAPYARAMTHLLVLTEAPRALVDPNVRPSIRMADVFLGANRNTVIITHSDDIDWPQMPGASDRERNPEALRLMENRSRSQERWFAEKLFEDSLSQAPVHSISNSQYKKHRIGYLEGNPPVMTAEATGIPALRSRLATFANDTRLEAKKLLLNDTIPSLLETLQRFALDQSITAAGGELPSLQGKLLQILPVVRDILHGSVQHHFDDLWEEYYGPF
ncbi:unnamed protein product [Zymoseptoria tritici ST99CH_1E4]|uniref:G domain-containing protein n=1 Tax=Zymoseptoria tritici ST99CH_1E4 TaxID=1276532 RepID=A0A2H1FZQ4_ZYMTR|nr:unnamed protein product [Zymoseptoria tritici ST99CH_1E4]